jgi:multidrug efflux system membrane fusion protein
MSGTILARTVEVGSLVGPGTVAFTLADTSRLDAVFGVPEAAARRLRAGRHVTLTMGDREEITLPGTVTEVAPAASAETGVFDVQVTTINRAGLGKPGMVATLTLAGTTSNADALAVPTSAIVQSRDQPGGFAVVLVAATNGQTAAQYRDVGIGATFGGRVIVRGLARGDRVVASGPSQLYDGEPVQVAPSTAGDDGEDAGR